jgi:hypothetical protein
MVTKLNDHSLGVSGQMEFDNIISIIMQPIKIKKNSVGLLGGAWAYTTELLKFESNSGMYLITVMGLCN